MRDVPSQYHPLTTPYRGTGQSPLRGLVTDHPGRAHRAIRDIVLWDFPGDGLVAVTIALAGLLIGCGEGLAWVMCRAGGMRLGPPGEGSGTGASEPHGTRGFQPPIPGGRQP